MRKLGAVVLGAALVVTGVYFVLYLYGWEWYRAFVVGAIFVGIEVAAATFYLAHLLGRLSDAARPGGPPAPHRDGTAESVGVVNGVLAATPRPHPDTFAWMKRQPDQLSVFIPLLLGAGFILSAAAWVVERLASAVYGERLDAGLAEQVAVLIPPDDLLDAPTAERLLTAPGRWASVRPQAQPASR